MFAITKIKIKGISKIWYIFKTPSVLRTFVFLLFVLFVRSRQLQKNKLVKFWSSENLKTNPPKLQASMGTFYKIIANLISYLSIFLNKSFLLKWNIAKRLIIIVANSQPIKQLLFVLNFKRLSGKCCARWELAESWCVYNKVNNLLSTSRI